MNLPLNELGPFNKEHLKNLEKGIYGIYIWGVEINNTFIPLYVGQAGGKTKSTTGKNKSDIKNRLTDHLKFKDNYNLLKVKNLTRKNSILKTDSEVKKMGKEDFEIYSKRFAYINFCWCEDAGKVIGGKNNLVQEKKTKKKLIKIIEFIQNNFRFKYIKMADNNNLAKMKIQILEKEKEVYEKYNLIENNKTIGTSLKPKIGKKLN